MTVNILGTEWRIILQTIEENEFFSDCDGYCDPSIKTIFVRNYTDEEQGKVFQYNNRETMRKKVIRHEVLHAFMFESGLWRNSFSVDVSWSMNEEMIDWFAIQGLKIYNAWKQADCI